MWKAFYVWKKNVRWKKFHEAKEILSETLFILNPFLSRALLDILTICEKLLELEFTDLENVMRCPLTDFEEVQVRNHSVCLKLLKIHLYLNNLISS